MTDFDINTLPIHKFPLHNDTIKIKGGQTLPPLSMLRGKSFYHNILSYLSLNFTLIKSDANP